MDTTDHRQLPTGGFTEEVIPFPDPEPLPSSSAVGFFNPERRPKALISPPVPQKLRPIRSNAGNLPVEDDMSATALMKMKSDMDANLICSLKSQISHLYYSFSSSSDCSGDYKEDPRSSGKRRGKRRKMELFLEDLMAQVMHKQEQMHQQLMELIEKKEKERIMREEAWRQQEMERAKREQESRAQRTAHNLALISFIHNALGGQELQIHEEDDGDHPQNEGQGEQDKCYPNSKRWPASEDKAHITLQAAFDHKFHGQGPKTPVWEEVQREVGEH